MKEEKLAKCTWPHKNCFARQGEECDALEDTVFPGRCDCPFFKPKKDTAASEQKDRAVVTFA